MTLFINKCNNSNACHLQVLFKMDNDGHGQEIQLRNLAANTPLSLCNWKNSMVSEHVTDLYVYLMSEHMYPCEAYCAHELQQLARYVLPLARLPLGMLAFWRGSIVLPCGVGIQSQRQIHRPTNAARQRLSRETPRIIHVLYHDSSWTFVYWWAATISPLPSRAWGLQLHTSSSTAIGALTR